MKKGRLTASEVLTKGSDKTVKVAIGAERHRLVETPSACAVHCGPWAMLIQASGPACFLCLHFVKIKK